VFYDRADLLASGGDGDDLIFREPPFAQPAGVSGNVAAIDGGAGDDQIGFTVYAGAFRTVIDGGSGRDTLTFTRFYDDPAQPPLNLRLDVDEGQSLVVRNVERVVFSGGTVTGGAGGDEIVSGEDSGDLILGGAGNDRLFGDERAFISGGVASGGDDRVFGDAGDDTVSDAAGSNYLRGGAGNDSILGGLGFDDAHGNEGNDTVRGGDSDDWVVGGKDDDVLFGEAGGDLVYGNLGDDTQDGGAGADTVRGGQGVDWVRGGDGADWISGDRGDDLMTGGAGADIFHAWNESGFDRITDFSVADGDRVYLLPGTAYSVAQSGADTVVDLGSGNALVLVGVQAASLPPGWIFS